MTRLESMRALAGAVEALSHVARYAVQVRDELIVADDNGYQHSLPEYAALYTNEAAEALLTLADDFDAPDSLYAHAAARAASQADDAVQDAVAYGENA